MVAAYVHQHTPSIELQQMEAKDDRAALLRRSARHDPALRQVEVAIDDPDDPYLVSGGGLDRRRRCGENSRRHGNDRQCSDEEEREVDFHAQ